MRDSVKIYLKKRCEKSRFFYGDLLTADDNCHIAVIIPVLNEFPSIKDTVNSLILAGEQTFFRKIRLVFVINNRFSASDEEKCNNGRCYEFLREISESYKGVGSNLRITTIAAFEGNKQFGEKDGVGLARKIGMDFALEMGDEILCCLDGDTTVETTYFSALIETISPHKAEFALFDFQHSMDNPTTAAAIAQYEFFLKSHSEKLKNCGSPYFPTAISPTVACTNTTYAQCGGMRENLAGEDFYFLQALIKTCVLGQMHRQKTGSPADFFSQIKFIPSVIHPSSRISRRTPFGTGRQVQKNSSPPEFPQEFYSALKTFYSSMWEFCLTDKIPENLPPLLKSFLEEEDFPLKFQQIRYNFRNNPRRQMAGFHILFDGLKEIRFCHYLQNRN